MKSGKKIHIRDAQKTDLSELLRIQKAAFMRYTGFLLPEQMPPMTETLDRVLDDFTRKKIIVAEYKDKLSGSIRYEIKGGVCVIERLSVMPELQGKGVGKALVGAVENRAAEKAHKVYLETGLLANNLLMFYTKLGYSGEAVLRKHYGGFDWIAFSKFLSQKEVK